MHECNNMKLSWLLFDLDNTLLDFAAASKASLWKSFEDSNVECSEDIYGTYKKINGKIWGEFERGEISARDLRTKRFFRLFQDMGDLNLNPSDFSKRYLENLVSESKAYNGVPKLLADLSKEYRISVVTNGLKEVQRARLDKLNLNQYFDSIIVSDEIGVAKPDFAFFEFAFHSLPNPPPKSEIMIIGDNPISDIQGGKDFGINTCLVTNGMKKNAQINSDLTIEKVGELQHWLL